MRYYILDTLGKYDEDKFCITDSRPRGLLDKKLALKDGGSLKGIYPENPLEVTMLLDEDSPKHIKLGSFVSNTSQYVMVSSKVVEEMKKYNIGEVEFWPFSLINHKGRVHSQDYCFVCPVHQVDALNNERSEIDRDANDVVIGTSRIVLDKKKLNKAPDLFRLNDTGEFVVSEPLAKVLMEKYTNFVFDEAEQA